uniref:Uncharacterized protein n=1 Tax=Glossina austeni TaxID=7395 RepID=A0A1A9UV64_GLOAU
MKQQSRPPASEKTKKPFNATSNLNYLLTLEHEDDVRIHQESRWWLQSLAVRQLSELTNAHMNVHGCVCQVAKHEICCKCWNDGVAATAAAAAVAAEDDDDEDDDVDDDDDVVVFATTTFEIVVLEAGPFRVFRIKGDKTKEGSGGSLTQRYSSLFFQVLFRFNDVEVSVRWQRAVLGLWENSSLVYKRLVSTMTLTLNDLRLI